MTPRPPRVVIVVDGGEHWSYWVRRALHRASRIWGGAGFAVIPHHDGEVAPALLRGCEAYDPDFVVTYSHKVEDVEHFQPGSLQVAGKDGNPATGAERQQMIDMVRTGGVPHHVDEAAQRQILACCSSYRSKVSGHPWHGDVVSLDDEVHGHFASVLDMPGTWQGPVVACPASWGAVCSGPP